MPPPDEPRSQREAARTPGPVAARVVPDTPADSRGDDQAGRGRTFVVQEHSATALHRELRLERDGDVLLRTGGED